MCKRIEFQRGKGPLIETFALEVNSKQENCMVLLLEQTETPKVS